MFVSGKHISRRIALRGMGAVIGLPLLDSMIPAFAAPTKAIGPDASSSPTCRWELR